MEVLKILDGRCFGVDFVFMIKEEGALSVKVVCIAKTLFTTKRTKNPKKRLTNGF
jgi:hypothetical protein